MFYCDRRKFNLTGGFIFLFMVTGRGIIFICSAVKILQIANLHILGNLDMTGHTHLKCTINLKKPMMFICRQKINFIFHVFLEISQRYYKLVILGTLGITGPAHKVILTTCRKLLSLYAGKKINFTSHVFLKILRRYANLFSFLRR